MHYNANIKLEKQLIFKKKQKGKLNRPQINERIFHIKYLGPRQFKRFRDAYSILGQVK